MTILGIFPISMTSLTTCYFPDFSLSSLTCNNPVNAVYNSQQQQPAANAKGVLS